MLDDRQRLASVREMFGFLWENSFPWIDAEIQQY